MMLNKKAWINNVFHKKFGFIKLLYTDFSIIYFAAKLP